MEPGFNTLFSLGGKILLLLVPLPELEKEMMICHFAVIEKNSYGPVRASFIISLISNEAGYSWSKRIKMRALKMINFIF